jgi:hypothetical protein
LLPAGAVGHLRGPAAPAQIPYRNAGQEILNHNRSS